MIEYPPRGIPPTERMKAGKGEKILKYFGINADR